MEFFKFSSDLPSVDDAWHDSVITNNKYLKAFYEQFNNVIPTPKVPEWEHIVSGKVQEYAEFAARGKMRTKQALKP